MLMLTSGGGGAVVGRRSGDSLAAGGGRTVAVPAASSCCFNFCTVATRSLFERSRRRTSFSFCAKITSSFRRFVRSAAASASRASTRSPRDSATSRQCRASRRATSSSAVSVAATAAACSASWPLSVLGLTSTSVWLLSSRFTAGWLRTFIACAVYCSVRSVSSALLDVGATHPMKTVRQFPPRESCSRRVSLDSRYGTWCASCCWWWCWVCASARSTFCSARSPALMPMLSLKRSPVLCVRLLRSDPARSTKWNFEEVHVRAHVTCRVNSEWLRLLASFMSVTATTRDVLPTSSSSMAWPFEATTTSPSPATTIERPSLLSPRMVMGCGADSADSGLCGWSRSRNVSL
eukprot:PhM_4_TR5975/c3_g1_i1/m.58584